MLKMKIEYGYLSLMCESNERKDKFQFENLHVKLWNSFIDTVT